MRARVYSSAVNRWGKCGIVLLALHLVGCMSTTPDATSATPTLEVRRAYFHPTPNAVEYNPPWQEYPVYLTDDVVVTHDDILHAEATTSVNGWPAVMIELRESASERVKETTADHDGLAFALYVDDELISIPAVHSQLGKRLIIMNSRDEFTEVQAQRLAESWTSAQ